MASTKRNAHPLIRARTCAYQGVRNVSFLENFDEPYKLMIRYKFLLSNHGVIILNSMVKLREIYDFW